MLKLNELYRKVARQIKTVFSDVELNEILDLEDIEYEKPGKSYLFFKRFFDIVISLIAIILLSPLMLIIAVIVKAEDGGYVIHKRKCIRTADYKTFTIYKFRSMRTDADDLSKWLSVDEISEYKKEIKLENDPRITKCGTFLRKLSLDELPQLFNILAGSMSLVGPRPIVPEEGVNYKDKLPMLLEAKPGLTGYWQVNGRSNVTYESKIRQGLELYYVANRSFRLDCSIFFKTFSVVLSRKGAR